MKICKNVLQIGDHLRYIMLRPYIKLFISKIKLMILNIDVLLVKVSITDGRRLILQFIGVLSFFTEAISKTIQNSV